MTAKKSEGREAHDSTGDSWIDYRAPGRVYDHVGGVGGAGFGFYEHTEVGVDEADIDSSIAEVSDGGRGIKLGIELVGETVDPHAANVTLTAEAAEALADLLSQAADVERSRAAADVPAAVTEPARRGGLDG